MEQEEDKKISKHHGSVSIIIRLDSLWRDTHAHSRNGLFSKWNADLDRIWCELARDLRNEGFKDKKELFDKFDEDLSKEGDFNDGGSEGFKKITKNEREKRAKQYKILMEKELFLRRLENELGKGTAYEDEDDYDMD